MNDQVFPETAYDPLPPERMPSPEPVQPEELLTEAFDALEPFTRDMVRAFTDLCSDAPGMILRDARWTMTDMEHEWIDPGLYMLARGTAAERVIREAPKARVAFGVVAWARRRWDYILDDIAAMRLRMSVSEYLAAKEAAEKESGEHADEPVPFPGPRAGATRAFRLRGKRIFGEAPGRGPGPEPGGIPDGPDTPRPVGHSRPESAGIGLQNPRLGGAPSRREPGHDGGA